jgi:hypothetical protein
VFLGFDLQLLRGKHKKYQIPNEIHGQNLDETQMKLRGNLEDETQELFSKQL